MANNLLAGLLPDGDPTKPFDPDLLRAYVVTRVAKEERPEEPLLDLPVDQDEPPGLAPPAIVPPPIASAPVLDVTPALAVPDKSRAIRQRRRKRSFAGPIMVVLVLLMFAGLATCVWMLTSGRLLTTDGQIVASSAINSQAPPGDPQFANSPEMQNTAPPSRPRRARDAVILAPRDAVPEELRPKFETPQFEAPPTSDVPAPSGETPAMVEPNEPAVPSEPEVPSEPSEPEEPMSPPASLPAAEENAEVAEILAQVSSLLRSGDWENAQPILSTATVLEMSEEQRTQLQGFESIAELLDYYWEGIRLGTQKVPTGDTFELAPGLTVAMVQASETAISLRVEGQTKRFELRDAPLVLLHRFTTFSLPQDDPNVRAAKSVFQALWSHATPAHRQQALSWLESIEPQEGLDVPLVISTLKQLFELTAADNTMERD